MQRTTAKRRIGTTAPVPAIVITGASVADAGSRFGMVLTVFMRVIAAFWMFEGLMQWSAVLVPGSGGLGGWAQLTDPAMVAVIFFAAVDLIAAVGLWLAAPWGGVIWLVTAGVQLLVSIVLPGFFEHPLLMGSLNLCLIALYLGLTWLAARPPHLAPFRS